MSRRGYVQRGHNMVEFKTSPDAPEYIEDVRFRRSDGAAALLRYGKPVAFWYLTPSQERSLRAGKRIQITTADLHHFRTATSHSFMKGEDSPLHANLDTWISAHKLTRTKRSR